VLPPPRLSGVLAVLPPLDVAALERGMQRFLDQVGQWCRPLVGNGDGAGLYFWVVAGAAAAAACEIARRQLKRTALVPAAAGDRAAGTPPIISSRGRS
jgi:hypothetical protein